MPACKEQINCIVYAMVQTQMAVVTYKNGERRLLDALSPSCLSDSMDLLQMSKGKVLQHFMQLQHLAGLLSWSAQACAAAKPCCDLRPIRR